jgi:uncharacterized protein YqeY
MSNLVNQIKEDSVKAIKNRETAKLSTLRLLVAELEKEKVKLKLQDVSQLTNEQAQAVINTQIKKLDKEIESYVAVGRETKSQELEKKVLYSYLPKQLSEVEIGKVVKEIASKTSYDGKNVGVLMKELAAKLKGKADMKTVSKIAKKLK